MKKYYITQVRSIKRHVSYNEELDVEVYTYIADIHYKPCEKHIAMERLERDRKLINMIDKLRR